MSDTGSYQFNAGSDTFPCLYHNQKHLLVLVLGFFWEVVSPTMQSC